VLEAVPGVRDVSVDNHRAELSFSGKMAALLRAVAERYDLVDVNTHEADLEEIFLTYYREDDAIQSQSSDEASDKASDEVTV